MNIKAVNIIFKNGKSIIGFFPTTQTDCESIEELLNDSEETFENIKTLNIKQGDIK